MKMETQAKNDSPAGSPQPARGKRTGLIAAVLAVAALGGLWALGYWPRAARTRQLAAGARAQQQLLPPVTVVPAREAPAEVEIGRASCREKV